MFKRGIGTGDNSRFLRFWNEIKYTKLNSKWIKHNKGGEFRRWFGNREYVINWQNEGFEIKNLKDSNGKLRSRPQNLEFNFKPNISYSSLTSGKISFRKFNGFTLKSLAGFSKAYSDGLGKVIYDYGYSYSGK